MKHIMKKTLAVLLVLCMAMSLLPATALAEGEPTHQHGFTAGETVDPTCEKQGYTVYKCECGESYEDDVTAALDILRDLLGV